MNDILVEVVYKEEGVFPNLDIEKINVKENNIIQWINYRFSTKKIAKKRKNDYLTLYITRNRKNSQKAINKKQIFSFENKLIFYNEYRLTSSLFNEKYSQYCLTV